MSYRVATFRQCCLCFALSAFFFPINVQAEREDCHIIVRTIQGVGKSAARSVAEPRLKGFIADMSGQLESLPYKEYRTSDGKEQMIAIRETATFSVRGAKGNQHTVVVSPHSLSGGRVNVTVNWTGPDGKEVVSTRQRVSNGQNVVLATEASREMSTIISVNIKCG